ncbi:MAG: class IV adenylate cyclase [Acidobacteria bacterium]|nr:MAG: class IV adenylate cyclase [Acidobacteriota bacterium]
MPHEVPREIEIKLKVEDPRALRKKLKECGFVVVERRHFESNLVFDFRNSRLRNSCSMLRLRNKANRHILTFKGPPQPSDSYKIRPEIEMEIPDSEALQQVLKALGLRSTFRYEKYRTTYAEKGRRKAAGSPLLVFDETPIGPYIELEGPSGWIDRKALRLGYRKADYIKATYGDLYKKQCLRKGIKPKDMVFSSSKS